MPTVDVVKKLIEEHNDSVDTYIKFVLPRRLRSEGYEVVDGRISLEAWFAAQRIIAEAHFKDKATVLCSTLRAFGYDVKRDAENKLIWNGSMIV